MGPDQFCCAGAGGQECCLSPQVCQPGPGCCLPDGQPAGSDAACCSGVRCQGVCVDPAGRECCTAAECDAANCETCTPSGECVSSCDASQDQCCNTRTSQCVLCPPAECGGDCTVPGICPGFLTDCVCLGLTGGFQGTVDCASRMVRTPTRPPSAVLMPSAGACVGDVSRLSRPRGALAPVGVRGPAIPAEKTASAVARAVACRGRAARRTATATITVSVPRDIDASAGALLAPIAAAARLARSSIADRRSNEIASHRVREDRCQPSG